MAPEQRVHYRDREACRDAVAFDNGYGGVNVTRPNIRDGGKTTSVNAKYDPTGQFQTWHSLSECPFISAGNQPSSPAPNARQQRDDGTYYD